MADFILEHEIQKTLFVWNGIHLGKPQIDGEDVVPIHKRDFSDYSLHFGTLVDILNNPAKYPKSENALRGHIVFEQDVTTDKYSFGEVSNAIEILLLNGQVTDYVNPHKRERVITLTPKGAIDYFDNFYPKKKQNEWLDIKIKKLTISNTKITRGIAIGALVISAFMLFFSIKKHYDEKSRYKESSIKSEQIQR